MDAKVVRIPTPIFRGRISLRKLKELPRGTFIISNVYLDGLPAIMMTIGEKSCDEIYYWIKENDLQGRLFYGFAQRVDYERWKRQRPI